MSNNHEFMQIINGQIPDLEPAQLIHQAMIDPELPVTVAACYAGSTYCPEARALLIEHIANKHYLSAEEAEEVLFELEKRKFKKDGRI